MCEGGGADCCTYAKSYLQLPVIAEVLCVAEVYLRFIYLRWVLSPTTRKLYVCESRAMAGGGDTPGGPFVGSSCYSHRPAPSYQ